MRTKKKDRGWGNTPYEPWNEIAPRLWMGGHEYIGLDGLWAAAIPNTEFDAKYRESEVTASVESILDAHRKRVRLNKTE